MIALDADETMLLLITKNWRHKDVTSDYQLGTVSYIQDCVNFRCFGPNYVGPYASLFIPYIDLCTKLLSAHNFASILVKLNEAPFWERLGLNHSPELIELMISELACRRVTDLILDESLIAKNRGEQA